MKETAKLKNESAQMSDLCRNLIDALREKKARDIVLLNLTQVNPYFDYFLLASAGSMVQLKSMGRDIQKRFGKDLEKKTSSLSQGDLESGWLVIDFIDVVVHLFLDEQRKFYNLERLWGDAGVTRFPD